MVDEIINHIQLARFLLKITARNWDVHVKSGKRLSAPHEGKRADFGSPLTFGLFESLKYIVFYCIKRLVRSPSLRACITQYT